MVCGGDIEVRLTYLSNDQKSYCVLENLYNSNVKNSIVYIFGAGHVSKELSKMLHYVDFETVIWDDRVDFANAERFEYSKEIICDQYNGILNKVSIKNDDFAVVMTRGHVSDYEVTKQLLNVNLKYIGVIGSSNKIKVMREKLLKDGFEKEKIDSICMPIGVQIGAETPEEIAVSIVSEIILFRSRMEERRKVIENNKLVDIYKDRGIKI